MELNVNPILMAIKYATQPLVNLTINQPHVYLTITIGNYQIGGSSVEFEDSSTPIAKGDISNLLLDTKQQLEGKKLKIVTTVLDSNAASNNISVTLSFIGTTTPPIIIHDTLDNHGDYYALTTEYQF